MSRLSLRLFGVPQIEVDDKAIEINRRKAVALLVYLAVTQQRHARDAVATMFWPEADQRRARASLRSALWALNKTAVAQWLLVGSETVALGPRPETGDTAGAAKKTLDVDVIRFRDLLAASQRHDHAVDAACAPCLDTLAEAVSLYQDDFLAGFTLPDTPQFDEWCFFQANALREELATALRDLMALYNAQGDPEGAIPPARRLVALDPLDEPAQRTLMQQYAEAGQRSAAIRQYEICRQTLQSELGVEPAPETKALGERLQSGAWRSGSEEERGADEGAAAGADKARIPHNLPPNPTPLVGRRKEVAAVTAFLDDQTRRLLTITGPGGIGKTRLALAAAAEQLAQTNFPDGVYFVPLAPLSDPEALVPAMAEAIGYPFQADKRSPRQQIVDFLGHKSILLLLDNFEHLLRAHDGDGADLVADLLQRAPHLKIVVTSREPLNLYEEQRYPLRGLGTADGRGGDAGTQYAAADLFLQSVRRRQPHFEVTVADSAPLAEICRLVEGMPLALEMAASWSDVLSLREIAAELRQSLDLMETNVRDLPARHRSMRAAFDTSWQSLSGTEQVLYAQLSVFRGGFTREAARAVADVSREALADLVRKSLLRFNRAQGRYEQHELLRQYAAQKLVDGRDETLRRHAAYYCAFLHQREADLKWRRRQQALAEIEADRANVVTAWRRSAVRSQSANLKEAVVPLSLFYEGRSRFEEGETLCRLAIEEVDSTLSAVQPETQAQRLTPEHRRRTLLLVQLLSWQGRFTALLGNYEDARRALRRAQSALTDLNLDEPDVRAARAFLLIQLSHYPIINEFGGKAEALNEEGLVLYRSIDDPWGTALALDALSQKKSNLGLHEDAIRLHEESLALRLRLEDDYGIARSYNVLGLLVLHVGQIERSEAYLRKSLALYRTLENPGLLSLPLAVLGINRLFAGDFEESLASWEEAWDIHRELGLTGEPHTANVGMTRARINLGRYEEARRQAEIDLAAYQSADHHWSIAFTLFNLGRIDLVEGAAELARQRLQESGRLLQEMDERSLLPDVLFCLAYAHRALHERERAIQYMIRALEIAIETEPLNPMRFELPGMALLLADRGEIERAVELYAAAQQSPYIANSRWFEDVAGRHITERAASLPPVVVAAAQERGRARDFWATANALLAELRGAGPEV